MQITSFSTQLDMLFKIGYVFEFPVVDRTFFSLKSTSLGAKSQILSSVAPPGRKTWLLFSVRDTSWGLGNPCFTKFSVVNFL